MAETVSSNEVDEQFDSIVAHLEKTAEPAGKDMIETSVETVTKTDTIPFGMFEGASGKNGHALRLGELAAIRLVDSGLGEEGTGNTDPPPPQAAGGGPAPAEITSLS